ncbi:MAG TPA: retropepsin-like aspartic protease [Gemmataceae bacterium]|nr:retropepsin-like aspartic protease [Gemmataceae bacterium]
MRTCFHPGAWGRLPARCGRLLLLLGLVLPLAGCRTRGLNEGPAVGGGQAVPMLVLRGPGGETLALVPIFINGQGPFAFALDTGASHSLVDHTIAEQLGLRVSGPGVKMTGVVAGARAEQVRVDQWRVGDVPLPAHTLVTLDLPEADKETGLHGLLGSDMLSQFEVITVDYQHQRLLFRPHR